MPIILQVLFLPLEWDEHGSKATARNDPSQVVPYFETLLIIDVEVNGGPLTVAAFLSGPQHPSFKVQTQNTNSSQESNDQIEKEANLLSYRIVFLGLL